MEEAHLAWRGSAGKETEPGLHTDPGLCSCPSCPRPWLSSRSQPSRRLCRVCSWRWLFAQSQAVRAASGRMTQEQRATGQRGRLPSSQLQGHRSPVGEALRCVPGGDQPSSALPWLCGPICAAFEARAVSNPLSVLREPFPGSLMRFHLIAGARTTTLARQERFLWDGERLQRDGRCWHSPGLCRAEKCGCRRGMDFSSGSRGV